MYICRHFKIYELVDEKTFDRYGLRAWEFFNPQALRALDNLREFCGSPITVNNYHTGGPFQFRGLRPRSCDVGADFSQHRLGNAFDCDIKGVRPELVRQVILDQPDHPQFALINCIEGNVNWLHFDCRNIPDRIRIVYP